MENQIIAKTLLTMWPDLGAYEAMLKERTQARAMDSFGSPYFTQRTMEQIIDLNVKQHTIHTLRTGLNRLIAQLPTDVRGVLQAHYRGRDPQSLGWAPRSFYRKLKTGTDYVAGHLPTLGINFFSWQYLLQHHLWIKEIFTRQLARPNRGQTPGRRTGLNHPTAHPRRQNTPAN